MSDNKQQIAPGNLPPSTLINYDDFSDFVPGMSRKYLERLAEAGRFVPGTRLMPRKPMVFRAGAVATWLAERTAALDAPVVQADGTAQAADIEAMGVAGKARVGADQ